MTDSTPAGADVAGAGLLATLRRRAFALYFAGQLLSQVGDGVYLVALPFLVLGRGGGPAELGVVLACYGAARVVMYPVGGTLSDRAGARPVMLVADACRAVVVLGFVALSFRDRVPLGALIPVAVAFGALDGAFTPASYAVLPQIVPEESLGAANSLAATMQSIAQVVGPAAGGALVAVVRSGAGFAVDSATFVVSSVTLLAIGRGRPVAAPARVATGASALTWAGVLRYALDAPITRMGLLVTFIVNLAFAGMVEVALPSLAQSSLHAGAGGYGTILVGLGAGSILGAPVGALLLRRPRRGLVALAMGVAQGVPPLAVALFPSLALATAAMLAVAAIQAALNVFYLTMLQRLVPPGALGRVMSLIAVCAGLAYALSAPVVGAAVQRAGPAPVIAAAGLCMSVAFGLGLLSRPYRNL
jgi:MFS family permease